MTSQIPRDDLGTPGRLMYTYTVIYFVLYDKLLLDYYKQEGQDGPGLLT